MTVPGTHDIQRNFLWAPGQKRTPTTALFRQKRSMSAASAPCYHRTVVHNLTLWKCPARPSQICRLSSGGQIVSDRTVGDPKRNQSLSARAQDTGPLKVACTIAFARAAACAGEKHPKRTHSTYMKGSESSPALQDLVIVLLSEQCRPNALHNRVQSSRRFEEQGR